MTLTTDPIVLSVMDKLNSRSQVGITKYGTTLSDNNADNYLLHTQQELLDGANYIEKLLLDSEKLNRAKHIQVLTAYCDIHNIPYTLTEVDVSDLSVENRRRFMKFDAALKVIFNKC